MSTELAVVTGGNRGIGLETCRQLGRRGFQVILCSRNPSSGEAAAAMLAEQGVTVQARQLDVADAGSIAGFAAGITSPVHALINNAGASFPGFDAEVARKTLAANYFGAAAVTEALRPRLARGARVVMVSSGMGELSAYPEALRERFLAARDRADVDGLVDEFVAAVRRGDHERAGWPSNAYRVSKAGLNALVRVLAPTFKDAGVLVNAVCPGWVRTDMGGAAAPRSLEQGAAGIVWAATLPASGPSGGFFRDGRAIPW